MIFFSDLDSGPATGNSDATFSTGGGVYVTLYGNYLTGGSVTLNGVNCLTVVSQPAAWLWYQRMVVQLGSSCTTGNFVVTVNGAASNGLPFTVRSGHIYYVATNGSDSNTGTFQSSWATLQHAADTMVAGDTTYAENGVVQKIQQGPSNGSLTLNQAGTSGNPIALIAYPGATVTVGDPGTTYCTTGPCWEGIYNGSNIPQPSYWTLGEMVLRGQDRAMDFNCNETVAGGVCTQYRVIGNDISCPWSDAPGTEDACVPISQGDHMYFYGNNFHDIASSTPASVRGAEAMGLYFSTDTNFDYVGWNVFSDVMARGGIEIHSTFFPGVHGYNQHDVYIHDNQMYNGCCDGIIIESVSPENGPVLIYNNVIHDWGHGPLTQNGGSYSCMLLDGGNDNPSNPAANGTVPVQVYNNTLYNCATGPLPTGAGFVPGAIVANLYNPKLRYNIVDNIVQQTGHIPYVIDYNQIYGQPSVIDAYGNNNDFFGSSAGTACDNSGNNSCLAGFTISLTSNPLFVSTATPDLHLQSGSPAASAGAVTPDTMDLDGLALPQGTGYPVGAYAK